MMIYSSIVCNKPYFTCESQPHRVSKSQLNAQTQTQLKDGFKMNLYSSANYWKYIAE